LEKISRSQFFKNFACRQKTIKTKKERNMDRLIVGISQDKISENDLNNFLEKFKFVPENAGLVGVERECFLADSEGNIAAISPFVLRILGGPNDSFGPELASIQLEDRIGPIKISALAGELKEREKFLASAEEKFHFKRLFLEVAPTNVPLTVYPDPTGRYQTIVKNLPRHILDAGCRVAAIHVHVGMKDHETALKVYNKATEHLDELMSMGDFSSGHRFGLYKMMAPNWKPRPYRNWRDYCRKAVFEGFYTDPRKCWTLIRISVHGTIEFRMFGSTNDLKRIVESAKRCLSICGFDDYDGKPLDYNGW